MNSALTVNEIVRDIEQRLRMLLEPLGWEVVSRHGFGEHAIEWAFFLGFGKKKYGVTRSIDIRQLIMYQHDKGYVDSIPHRWAQEILAEFWKTLDDERRQNIATNEKKTAIESKPEFQGFMKKIRENPQDRTVRLVFADWLEENGDLARAKGMRA